MAPDKLTLRKKITYWIILLVLTISFSLCGSELLVRIVRPDLSTHYGFFPSSPYVRDSFVGWRHQANAQFNYRKPEFEVNFSINSEGFRSSSEFISGSEKAGVIAVLGDSFVEALQVEESDTFVKLLEARLKPRGIGQVQNYGVSNLGVVHYLQMYKYYARNHHPEIVLIVVLDQNDIRNSSPSLEFYTETRPSYVLGNEGEVIDIAPFSKAQLLSLPDLLYRNLPEFLLRHFAVFRFFSWLKQKNRLQGAIGTQFPKDAYIYEEPWNDDFSQAWSYSSWALQELVRAIRDDGAKPVLILMPGQWTTSEQAWQSLQSLYDGEKALDREQVRCRLRELAETMQVNYLDLTDTFRNAYKNGQRPHWEIDGHLTQLGHELVAEAIYHQLGYKILVKAEE